MRSCRGFLNNPTVESLMGKRNDPKYPTSRSVRFKALYIESKSAPLRGLWIPNLSGSHTLKRSPGRLDKLGIVGESKRPGLRRSVILESKGEGSEKCWMRQAEK